MKKMFYICPVCGNLVEVIHDGGVPMMCCGKKMEAIEPNTVDASGEKHLPVVCVENGVVYVNVGTIAHPMLTDHYIQWIYLKTEKGCQRRDLMPGDSPEAKFCVVEDKVEAAYAYCNIHGLWMTEVE